MVPINLRELVENGLEFTVNREDVVEEDPEADLEYKENLLKFINMNLVGVQDENVYVTGQPFETISAEMTDLVNGGAIKKRIIREGYGEKPKDSETVYIHYNAYIEFNAEPFDSTYARKKPHQFLVNCGKVIIGLDIAVQSMKVNEKSQFIIQPNFAYGQLGCLQRVPPNTEVLFEIELLQIVNVGAASRFDSLPEDEQRKFTKVYEYCLALCAKAKDLYEKNINGAIREYNVAVGKLEFCQLDTEDDQLKQQELLLKLYSNLLVAYTRIGEPKKGCINFNRINELIKGTDIKITAKMYYNNSKCLRMLSDFNMAKKRLNLALKLEPKNPEILNEMLSLDKEIQSYRQKEKQMSKVFLSSAN